jgi:single-strand DNA-binding protein
MAGSVSKTILVGRLGKDPETRTFQDGGKVVNFSLATTERWKDKTSGEPKERTEWHNIAIFNEALAEVAERYLTKGALVYLEGQNETRVWEKNGQKHYTTEVVLRQFNSALQMLESRDAGQPAAGQGRARAARNADGPV